MNPEGLKILGFSTPEEGLAWAKEVGDLPNDYLVCARLLASVGGEPYPSVLPSRERVEAEWEDKLGPDDMWLTPPERRAPDGISDEKARMQAIGILIARRMSSFIKKTSEKAVRA